jgi:hypothetical protein
LRHKKEFDIEEFSINAIANALIILETLDYCGPADDGLDSISSGDTFASEDFGF